VSLESRLQRLELATAQCMAAQPQEQAGDHLVELLLRLNNMAIRLTSAPGPLPPLAHESAAGRAVRTALAAGEIGSEPYYRTLREQLVAFIAEFRVEWEAK
jgi:hypothetical protein